MKIGKILIGPSTFAELDNSPMEKLISSGFEVINNPFKRKYTESELINLLSDNVIGLLAGLEPLNHKVLQQSKLKVISRVGSGMSNVDLQAAKEFGISVCNTPTGPTRSVAELTIGNMLILIRMIPQMNWALHNNNWDKKIGVLLEGKTVAIVGFGKIGKCVAELLKPFNAKIIIVDPFLKSEELNYSTLPIEDVLPIADIISIHSSGDDCLFSDIEFSKMKRGVYILNAARGGLISENALLKALDNKIVAGAWLDSFENEPYKGPLTNYDQVILTPHIGSYTFECRKQMETEAVNNLIKKLKVSQ